MKYGEKYKRDEHGNLLLHPNIRYTMEGLHKAESQMRRCFNCGSELKQWEPQIGTDPANREKTPFKWCPGCCWVVLKTLAVIADRTENQIALYMEEVMYDFRK